MPSYGTEGGLPIRPVTVQTGGWRYAPLRYTWTANKMPAYGTQEQLQTCSATGEAIGMLNDSGGRSTDMPSYGRHGGSSICPVCKEISCTQIHIKTTDLLQGTLTSSFHSRRWEGNATIDDVTSLQRSSSIYLGVRICRYKYCTTWGTFFFWRNNAQAHVRY
jgi:hypothetical protein